MSGAHAAQWAIWGIDALSTLAVIVRPAGLPEALWAVIGGLLLVLSGLLPWTQAWQAVLRGTDVYMFLTGMMLLAELARREGLFEWLAAHAARGAGGSPRRLFALVYAVGVAVTVLLSNDATAVVLTPAVAAVARSTRARPLPYLLICAFIANAASFVLPISNPANLVVFDHHLPPLSSWLARFALPSLLSILLTYASLWITQRRALSEPIVAELPVPGLTGNGRLAAGGILLTAAVLLVASWRGADLGLPTLAAALATLTLALVRQRRGPGGLLRAISWGILPLVAGLFVMVQALRSTGVVSELTLLLQHAAAHSATAAAWMAGVGTALACNLANNLPVGVVVGTTLTAGSLPAMLANTLLIGVDLGPNLSVTGSLATILWLVALRREGEQISAWRFLAYGVVVMVPALLAAIAVSVALS